MPPSLRRPRNTLCASPLDPGPVDAGIRNDASECDLGMGRVVALLRGVWTLGVAIRLRALVRSLMTMTTLDTDTTNIRNAKAPAKTHETGT